ncbi:DnaT-like ssDNA-binding domain-containing protein [Vitreoscilla stercoraria]|uniref:DnaT DNA-binding domain-containing protein n=1 Tax=Vitreoscilla stercoraria TaxID=61 RepID=A0ABY4EC97_VITST|nr:DnaT-like ssDNA-binding domain-containing protein [Vitreoscilla stercoraria]UOO93370.1 hypothetical protein LVJ81_04905 [Vitreoscilla stercoraria]
MAAIPFQKLPEVSAKMELQQLIGKPVATYPQLAKPFGSKQAADLFSQLLYWWDMCDQSTGFYTTLAELAEQTGLTISQIKTARDKLVALGVVQIKENRIQHVTFFKLDLEAVKIAVANAKNRSPEVKKSLSGSKKIAVAEVKKSLSYIEQRLPKTTTENTYIQPAHENSPQHTAPDCEPSKSQPQTQPKVDDQKFAMHIDWQPDHAGQQLLKFSRVDLNTADNQADFAEFLAYWMTQDVERTQAEWNKALLRNFSNGAKARRTAYAESNKPATQKAKSSELPPGMGGTKHHSYRILTSADVTDEYREQMARTLAAVDLDNIEIDF